jgi:hypothetical protein
MLIPWDIYVSIVCAIRLHHIFELSSRYLQLYKRGGKGLMPVHVRAVLQDVRLCCARRACRCWRRNALEVAAQQQAASMPVDRGEEAQRHVGDVHGDAPENRPVVAALGTGGFVPPASSKCPQGEIFDGVEKTGAYAADDRAHNSLGAAAIELGTGQAPPNVAARPSIGTALESSAYGSRCWRTRCSAGDTSLLAQRPHWSRWL